ncbi:MAG: hypothetical protein AAGA20_18205 [Planctomycetota bacterium]
MHLSLHALPALLVLSAPALAQGAADKFDADETPAFRGTVHSQFAGWDVFTVPFAAPNFPDDTSSDLNASITQLTPGAIITSTQNIYHPSSAPFYEIDVFPGAEVRQVVFQARTLGNLVDTSSMLLNYPGGTIAPTEIRDLTVPAFSYETYYAWDLTAAGVSVTDFTLTLNGAAGNVSLDAALLDVRTDGVIGTNYCSTNANSTGQPGSIEARGSDVFEINDVTLVADDLPFFSAGYFLASTTQDFVANPAGSQGNLCLGGDVGRYNTSVFNTGTTGAGSLTIDLTSIPQPNGPITGAVGETWNFQCWYRDTNPSVTSNFTNGVSVTLN